MRQFLTLPILVPIVLGIALLILQPKSRRVRSIYIMAASLATTALSLACIVLTYLYGSGFLACIMVRFNEAFSISLRIDGASMVYGAIVSVLWPLVTAYSLDYMSHEGHENRFFAFWLMAYGVVLGIAYSEDFLTLYFFYEVLTLTTLPLVMHAMDEKARYAGRKYLVYSLSGAAFAFIGIVFLLNYGVGHLNFTYGGILDQSLAAGNERTLELVFVAAFFGFGVKAAVFPFHGWLPDASVAPTPVSALLLLLWPGAALELPGVVGFGLRLQAGRLGSLLALVSAFLWAATGLNCPSYFAAAEGCNRFYFFWLLTLGALMGVFLAADLFTLFVFFEMMSFTSYVWVVQNETEEARQAGQTYLAVAVIGGMALLAGLLLLQQLLGTLEFSAMAEAVSALPAEKRGSLYVAGGCALVGFGAKAGMFPLHIWLPKAHPVAPAPASALLSGILTKSGVFGVLILCRYLFWTELPWNTVVLALGVVTMVLGAVLALFSVDLKRTLACSSMSQIGFILVGTAMQGFLNGENALAAWGTVLHMLNHSLIKLVLFVAAGVVYLGTHSLNLNDIRAGGGTSRF